MGACGSVNKAPGTIRSQKSSDKKNPLIQKQKANEQPANEQQNPNKQEEEINPTQIANENQEEQIEANQEQDSPQKPNQDQDPAEKINQEQDQPEKTNNNQDLSILDNTEIQQVQQTEQNDEIKDELLDKQEPLKESHHLDHQEEFSEEQKEKIRIDNYSDLKYINIDFLDLKTAEDIYTFIDSEFFQMILQCQLMTVRMIVDHWQVDQVVLYDVGCRLYDQMTDKKLKYKDYNNDNMIKHLQKDMDKSLKEFTDLIRKKKLRKFKNAQYGAKFLEVMTESYQLIFQQKKVTKTVSLYRKKEQYTEFLVLEMKNDPMYQMMIDQLPIINMNKVMSIDWWKPKLDNYSNLFFYLDYRYFNLKGVIQYEIILSSAKGAVPGCSYMGLQSKLKSQVQANVGKTAMAKKIGESMDVKDLDVSDIMFDKRSDINVDDQEIKNMDEFVRNL